MELGQYSMYSVEAKVFRLCDQKTWYLDSWSVFMI